MPDPNDTFIHRVHQARGWVKSGGELDVSGEREAERRHENDPEPDMGDYLLATPEPLNDCGTM